MLNRVVPLSQWRAISLLALLIFMLISVRFYLQNRTPPATSPAPVVVEVCGDVRHPGIYLLNGPVATVSQALKTAGGRCSPSSPEASENPLNQKLRTGERLRITCRGTDTMHIRITPMEAAARLTLGEKLDVNEATEAELILVSGMRPEFAKEIVQRRREKPWRSLQELEEISGVGPKTVQKWEDYLEVPGPSDQ